MPNSVQKSMSQYINNDGRGITPFVSTLGASQGISLFTEDNALTYTASTGGFQTSAKPPAHDSQQPMPTATAPTERERITSLWLLPDDAPVTTVEAGAMLARSPRTLEHWRLNHKGLPYQAGGRVTYRVGDLRDYQRANTVRPRN